MFVCTKASSGHAPINATGMYTTNQASPYKVKVRINWLLDTSQLLLNSCQYQTLYGPGIVQLNSERGINFSWKHKLGAGIKDHQLELG